jgi:lysophospholipase L1-like esterase
MSYLIADRCRLTATTNVTAFTTGAGANYRVSHRAKVAAENVCLVYDNTTNWGTSSLAELVISSAINIAGTPTRVTFGGNETVTIPVGSRVKSDPIPGLVTAAEDLLTSSTYVHSNGSGGFWPALTPGASEFTDTGGTTKYYNDTDYSLTTPYPSGSAGNHFGCWPCAIVGDLLEPTRVIACIGDSICAGQGVSRTVGGMFEQAARANGYPVLNAGIPGKQASQLDGSGEWAVVASIFDYADAVLCNLGTNDLGAGATSAQVITRITDIATLVRGSGKLFYQSTILPKSTSSDSWVTTGNQTTAADNAARIAVNTWLRTNPAAIDGYIETANLVESAEDSGLWAAPGGAALTGDGTHPNTAGYAALAAMDLSGIPVTPGSRANKVHHYNQLRRN